MQNAKCRMQNYFSVLDALQIAVRIPNNSCTSAFKLKYCDLLKKSVRYNSFSQYCVSLASFKAMFIFAAKSALLWPLCASAMLAPILVPHRKSCLERVYYLCSRTRYLYKFTILTANSKLFSTAAFCSMFNLILHSAFSILHSHYSTPRRYSPLVQAPGSKGAGSI